jgi:hypothetical protein
MLGVAAPGAAHGMLVCAREMQHEKIIRGHEIQHKSTMEDRGSGRNHLGTPCREGYYQRPSTLFLPMQSLIGPNLAAWRRLCVSSSLRRNLQQRRHPSTTASCCSSSFH